MSEFQNTNKLPIRSYKELVEAAKMIRLGLATIHKVRRSNACLLELDENVDQRRDFDMALFRLKDSLQWLALCVKNCI